MSSTSSTASAFSDAEFADLLARVAVAAPTAADIAQIATAVLRRLEAERVFVYRLRRDGGFRVLAARDFDGEAIRNAQRRMSHYAIRRAEKEKDVLVVADARVDRRYRSEVVVEGGKPPRSIAILPVTIEDQLYGGVYLDHRFRAFDPDAVSGRESRAWIALLTTALRLRDSAYRQRRLERRLTAASRGTPPVAASAELGERRSAARAAPPASMSVRGDVEEEEFFEFVSANPDLRDTFDDLRQVAAQDIPVLIRGETGVGKSLLARAVHLASPRAERPLVVLACGSVPSELAESELLGHVRGAFSGAETDREGIVTQADGGTLVLDEVADMSLDMQTKLLRVLEDGVVRPLGSGKSVEVDVRVIATTSSDLEERADAGQFRPDLYFRLKGFAVELSPLRERREDIPILARRFLERYTRSRGERSGFSEAALARLSAWPWPGNVRELENEVRRVAALGVRSVESSDLDLASTGGVPALARALPTLDEVVALAEERAIVRALEQAGGNKSRAADALGITRKALYRRLKKYRIGDERRRPPADASGAATDSDSDSDSDDDA